MQTSRLLPAIAAIVLCASTFSTRADDTPAQAAARAALMQDMNETGSVETPTPPPATPTAPPVVVPPPTPPAPVIPPPSTPPPVTAAPEPQATAPVAVQGSSTNLVLPPVEQETIPTNQVTQYPVNPAPGTMWPSANTNSAGAQATATSALTGQTDGNNEPSTTQTPAMTGAASEAPTAPPVPLTDSQQQQLQALLQQYEANQITPAQYQAGRAKILAGQ
ncbi:MAG TPA: hypothetical protein VK811_09120 [Candidatus Acidoferrum sp.]|jgi:hypothetical protein|nr:hypothetical protein [Candidatus Acidoferrum sp.]